MSVSMGSTPIRQVVSIISLPLAKGLVPRPTVGKWLQTHFKNGSPVPRHLRNIGNPAEAQRASY
jgi:hypothetical protein